MDYLEFSTNLQGKIPFAGEILTAQLAEIGFESFSNEENRSYKAYIQKNDFDQQALTELIETIEEHLGELKYTITELETVNWNAEWEAQFEPVEINSSILIKAPFHTIENEQKFRYIIEIEPKMSFGTGHHETTSLVLQTMLDLDFTGKTVADCGCGTGVLAIAALQVGAQSAYAFDYDPLCYENTLENKVRNNAENLTIEQGDLSLLEGKTFDIVLANINRNILAHNMHYLAKALKPNGQLVLSGFYEHDIEFLLEKTAQFGLRYQSCKVENKWAAVQFANTTINQCANKTN
ncbi:MAG: 50S ribosomal protein L11 methyltransferase [Bacteroidetes bacterium]|nr:50S ribosomal protein L11 methyltransferase [Bacteroidota bacterium]MCL2329525.1 50S ribosomal protein L11 methyltransferase [Bacteroidota bacterium]